MNPFALTAEERAGAMMAPARTPDVGAFMDNIDALRAMLGPSVAQRMVENTEDQKAWLAAGNRGPRPLTEDRVWLADDVAGALLGPIGMAGMIKAYHGSPHRFNKFSMDKIGTGEGAQAYGHGLYFAESENVAKGYRATLAPNSTKPKPLQDAKKKTAEMWRKRADEARAAYEAIEDKWSPEASKASQEMRFAEGQAAYFESEAATGALYTTRLDVEPDDLLDWDAPLSQQSEKVKKALREMQADADTKEWIEAAIKVGEPVSSFVRLFSLDPEEQSRILREAGIPGIRYLDQGSRASGEGTRNFVIFDDSLISIESVD